MHIRFGSVLLLGAVAAASLAAQDVPSAPQRRVEVAAMYTPFHSNENINGGFWMQGGAVQMHARFWRNLGLVADIAGSHVGNIDSSGVGLDMVTTTFGPRVTWSISHPKLSIYGQGLVGEANAFNGVFPARASASTNANSLAILVGGGAIVNCSPHLAVRAIETDWLRTQLPNATTGVQNNLRLGAGVVFRFR
jgi:outer membrane immunogenic protein